MRRASVALLVATAFARAVGSEPMEEEPEEEEPEEEDDKKNIVRQRHPAPSGPVKGWPPA